MKIKTSKLTGAALDWAVNHAEGLTGVLSPVNYCGKWEHGGPIIERVRIDITFMDGDEVDAWHVSGAHGRDQLPLIAAMRCYVASKLGDDVDVPKELT